MQDKQHFGDLVHLILEIWQYLHFLSFFKFNEILVHGRQGLIYPAIKTMSADALVMNGVRASASKVLYQSARKILLFAWKRLKQISTLYLGLYFLSPTNEKSTLVQVMAWCHQATSHYLSQCWPTSLLPYGIRRPQYVKLEKSDYSVVRDIPRSSTG